MRVAVLADIHGNLPALEAVLREVEAAGPDAIVLNGDLADGPMPGPTLDRLAALGDRAIWVRGNSDRCLADTFDGMFQPTGLDANAPAQHYAWCAARISQAPRDRLAALPLADTRRVINPGSVGMPYGHSGAGWALLGPDVALRRTQYDAEAAATAMEASAADLPGIEFIAGNARASASDADALAAFAEAEREQAG